MQTEERREYDRNHRKRTLLHHRKYFRDWYAVNAEKIRKRQRIKYHENKEKHRFRHIKKTYGISKEQFDTMMSLQGGKCLICRKDDKLHVDHCHKTGVIRGLLCSRCNMTLGKVNDDISILKSMIDYLGSYARWI